MLARSRVLGRLIAPILFLSLVSSSLPLTAAADWGDGVCVGSAPRGITDVQLIRPTLTDLLVLWQIVGNETAGRAARLTDVGAIVWGDAYNLYASRAPFPGTPDGTGGLLITHTYITPLGNRDVYLEGVHGDGSHAPAAPEGWAVAATSATEVSMAIASDGAGGAYVGWLGGSSLSPRLKRFLSDGSSAPGWPAAGLSLGAATGPGLVLDGDGAGGAYAVWIASGEALALRVGSGGAIEGGWPASGLLLGTSASVNNVRIFPSGTARIAVWLDRPSGTSSGRVTMQRFLSNGTRDPVWPAAGRVVLDQASAIGPVTFLSDGLDGVTVLWEQSGLPRALHVLSNGTIAPGYPAAGKSPLDAGAQYVPLTPGGGQVAFAGAIARDGGVVFVWNDARPSQPGIRARWLLGDGTSDPVEPDEGRVASAPGAIDLEPKAAIDDGQGGVYVAWRQGNYDLGLPTLWVNRLVSSALVDVGPPGSGSTLGLRAPVPNPANGTLSVRLSLPSDAPARLELTDLAGRRVRAQVLAGAGERTARFDGLDRMAPGVYLLRLTQNGGSRFARVAIMH